MPGVTNWDVCHVFSHHIFKFVIKIVYCNSIQYKELQRFFLKIVFKIDWNWVIIYTYYGW